MNIPNDTGYPWRLNKFVEYQHFAEPVEPSLLCTYAKRRHFSEPQCIALAWYYSLTYCEVTAILLWHFLGIPTKRDYETFWIHYKDKLIFQSARKYVKNMDWFVTLMETFVIQTKGKPNSWLSTLAHSDGISNLKSVEATMKNWKYMGRFSIDLFTEMLVNFYNNYLISTPFEYDGWDWKNCSNLTSGLFNMFYRDEEADWFDERGKLDPDDVAWLNRRVLEVKLAINKKYPESSLPFVSSVNKICSYRNLFKGARYGGYHHDRQLGNLYEYKKNFPKSLLWDEIFELRKELFNPALLGELNGWTGIRPELKKLFVTQGLTGVEKCKDC